MQYVIFTDFSSLETWQAACDAALGYPEPLSNLHHVGIGPHAPLELGRALHFAEAMTDESGTRWALPYTDAVATPEGATVVDTLPDDWWPSLEM